MELVHETEPEQLGALDLPFDDSRLPEMLFRLRARNYPQTLNQDERNRWNDYRKQCLLVSNKESGFTYDDFTHSIAELRKKGDLDKESREILDELDQYANEIISSITKT